MNRNHLAIFHAVAEAGSFSRGADRLLVSQPAVSKQVGELEARLGVKLFDRLPKGIRLTEAGSVLAAYARRMLDLEEQAERAMAELRGLTRGRLAIGASTTIGAYLLPEILGQFRRMHPGVELHLEIGNTEDIQHQLIEGRLDLGLTEGLVEDERLEAEVFREDELVVIAPPGHPILAKRRVTAERLAREPLILREPGSGTRAVVERALAAKGISIRPVMSMGSTEAIKRAVAAGVGLAIVSELTVKLETESGRLAIVPLSDLTLRRPLHLLRLRGRDEPAAVKEFLGMMGRGK